MRRALLRCTSVLPARRGSPPCRGVGACVGGDMTVLCAVQSGLGVTVHAGEVDAAAEVDAVLAFRPDRVGHLCCASAGQEELLMVRPLCCALRRALHTLRKHTEAACTGELHTGHCAHRAL